MATDKSDDKTTSPDPNTGDVAEALKAQQADLAAIYRQQESQSKNLISLNTLQKITNDQLRKQTETLSNIYRLLTRNSGTVVSQTAQFSSRNPLGGRSAVPDLKHLEQIEIEAQQASINIKEAQSVDIKATTVNLSGMDFGNASQETNPIIDLVPLSDGTVGMNPTDTEVTSSGTNALASMTQGLNPEIQAGTSSAMGDIAGSLVGDLGGELAGGALSAALTPVLGPVAPIVGEVGGQIVGDVLEETIGAAFDVLKESWENLQNQGRKTRDKILEIGFDKIRTDVTDMGTYAVDVYRDGIREIYSSWDKNLETVTATMGYTKEAVNTLQDSVAQRLDRLGYSQAINAANYLDELNSVLSANLNGTVAEIFATQSLILEKAVPEIDLNSMAAQFAAVYTNAERQGSNGEATMTEAMNQIAGAVKAIEKTTDGNNQFIAQVPAYLEQAQEIVAIAGGSADKVASLTTEMMSAEGPLASLAPQLSGFTGQLVDILTNQNDSTAVALRAIMHDINNDIGISATDFMNSFMEDTKGTLVTAFEALDTFIDKNQNEGARQEFLQAMESLFGIQGETLAQLDFQYIGDQLAQTNAHLNTAALLDAEALVKNGETATLEEQLVNNTANMLLAQNAVKDTLDNALMRKLEENELRLEELVYTEAAVQSVNLAEDTMGFFTKIKDIFIDLLDPFGLFKAANSAISSGISSVMNAANYALVTNMSSIGSDVASDIVGSVNTMKNTVGGATAAIASAQATDGNSIAVQAAMETAGIAGSTQSMFIRHAIESMSNTANAAITGLEAQSETAIGNYQNTVEEQRRKEEQAQQDAEQERLRQEAADANAARVSEEQQREQDNHDNLIAVSSKIPEIQTEIQNMETLYQIENEQGVSRINDNIDEFTETYVSENSEISNRLKQLQEDGVHTIVSAIYDAKPDVSKLSDINEGVERVITLFSTYLEFLDTSLKETTGSGLQMSYSDRAQILGRGLLT